MTGRAKSTKCIVLVDGEGTPLGLQLDSASMAEYRLATVSIRRSRRTGWPRQKLDRLIGNRARVSAEVREELRRRGIEPIIPAPRNSRKATGQDGRKQRRY